MSKGDDEWAVAFAHLVKLLRERLPEQDVEDLVRKAKNRARRMLGRRKGP